MDPAQSPRLLKIEKNTHHLLSEASGNGWHGEAEGLEETLIHIAEKKEQNNYKVPDASAMEPATR